MISGQDLFIWYQQAQKEAIAFDVDQLELDWLLQELTDLDSLSLRTKNYINQAKINSSVNLTELDELWQKRIKNRCPVQYLVGKCHWRNFIFKVTKDVLIPRPETEIIIDIIAEFVKKNSDFNQGNWLDLGTGSGAIAIGLADILSHAKIYAIDKSNSALKIAQENAINLGYQKQIKFIQGSWFTPLEKSNLKFQGIVSNPPYIPSNLVLNLQPEVANHEPKIALDGGKNGLKDIQILINKAPEYLIDKGILLLEIMQGQAEIIKHLLSQNGNYINIKSHQDLAQIDRFIFAQKKTIPN